MSLYVHVPFCVSKCRYCAFHSRAGAGREQFERFVELLPREIELRGLADFRPGTIYVGGGTPSLLGPSGIAALLNALPGVASGGEVTVEVNPADVTPALAQALADAGANRVSVGAQSFAEPTLRFLGRRHGAAETRNAVAALRSAGIFRVSLDLIAAVPGEPAESFVSSLREAVALEPDHVSVYPLSVEPGTPLARDGVSPPPDDAALSAVATAEEFLGSRGFFRYELSNYARPGAECRHNLATWLGRDYAGLGPAAHSRLGLERRANAPDFEAWAAALASWKLPPADVSLLSAQEDATERFITRIRLSRWEVPEPDSPDGLRRLGTLRALSKKGIVRDLGHGAWSLTARGREVADAVMAELV